MTESFSSDSGSLTMKSMLMVSHGASGIGSRWSSPVGGRRGDLVRRHKSQVETYLPIYLDTVIYRVSQHKSGNLSVTNQYPFLSSSCLHLRFYMANRKMMKPD